MSEVVRLEKSGMVGLVIIDSPPVNALSETVRLGLQDCFRKAASDESIEAIVLMCDGRTFIAGADIAELDDVIGDTSYHELFAQIEGMAKPVVAGLHGTALGGGVEAALACHYRVADGKTKIGFPEINLGIVPGAGGTQRLPRVIGVKGALNMLLSGRPVDASDALSSGLIDAVTDDDLRQFAIDFAGKLVKDGNGPRRACDVELKRDAETDAFLEAERARVAAQMPDREVPGMDIDAVEAAVDLPFDKGLVREKEISDASLRTLEARAMMRLFFAERQTSKIPGIDPALAKDIASGGIIGAGTMGRGIAMAFANAGIPVRLLDVDKKAVDAGLDAIRGEYQRRVDKGRMTAESADSKVALITGATNYADIADADVVIEAVFENMALKKEIFAKLTKTCKQGAILATNTSTLDVAEIASATDRPQDVVGLHFFSPAQVMRLLEVVRTGETTDEIIATSMRLAGRLRKVGVLSANQYGFIGNRMMDPYGREAEHMLLEGATPRQIDSALERFGMAMGILAVFDMAGVDVGYKVREERKALLPDDPGFYRASALLVERGWLGQKTGCGYYRYEKGSRERLDNQQALDMFAAEADRLGIERRDISDQEIVDRCVCALINEGAKVLEEKVALRGLDVDVVYTSGYGFPRHRGGPMFYADTLGLDTVCSKMEKFAAALDPQYWQPATLLRDLSRSGTTIADFSNV
ncbi:MAG: 3-hydroxyacyl-CoA dehydrogenase NAD-binding domain-containing protein [Woeseiaceae bacterium]|nr:3-hydroxyacyl-CoA dehydrogenase NAD-binding domain-containing protein [Woeseiaceae bacterium]